MPLIRKLRAMAAVLVVVAAAMLVLLTFAAWHSLNRSDRALDAIDQFRLSLVVAEMASRERGPTNGLLGDPLPHAEPVTALLREARTRTDRAFEALLASAGPLQVDDDARYREAREQLARARRGVDELAARPLPERSSQVIHEAVAQMAQVPVLLAPLINDVGASAEAANPAVANHLQAARLVAELREYAGLLGSHFTAALAGARPLTRDEFLAVQRTWGRIDQLRFLVDVRLNRPQVEARKLEAWVAAQERYFGASMRLVEKVIADSDAGRPYGLDPAGFAQAYVPDMNSLFEVRDRLVDVGHRRTEAARANGLRILAGVLAVAVALTGLLLWIIAVMQRRILKPLGAVAQAVHELAHNRPLSPLPQPVAADEMAAVIGAVRSLQERTQQRLVLEQERDSLIEQLRNLSNTDALTGLLNRRGFFEAGEHVLQLARRHGFAVSVVLFDVDHFKRINDELGHTTGDETLVEVAQACRAELRESDLAGRIGGEEFAVLLSHCDVDQAEAYAERVRAALERLAPRPAAKPGMAPLKVTASFGVIGCHDRHATLQSLLSSADVAMYRAKTNGRNRVVALA